MFYYIDFSTWIMEADSEKEAIQKALDYMRNGSPAICSVEPIPEANEHNECEHIEYEEGL